jgi:hypothetical protein
MTNELESQATAGESVTGLVAKGAAAALLTGWTIGLLACSEALSPEGLLGTWELHSVNGSPVPGTVMWMGTERDFSAERLILLSISDTLADGSSAGVCRYDVTEGAGGVLGSWDTDECEYSVSSGMQFLDFSMYGSRWVRFSLSNDRMVLESIEDMIFAHHEIVYRRD